MVEEYYALKRIAIFSDLLRQSRKDEEIIQHQIVDFEANDYHSDWIDALERKLSDQQILSRIYFQRIASKSKPFAACEDLEILQG